MRVDLADLKVRSRESYSLSQLFFGAPFMNVAFGLLTPDRV